MMKIADLISALMKIAPEIDPETEVHVKIANVSAPLKRMYRAYGATGSQAGSWKLYLSDAEGEWTPDFHIRR